MATDQDEKPFSIEIAKRGRAVCKKCTQKCQQGVLRIAKLSPNPSGNGKLRTWYHIDCIFEMFLKQRPTTKRIEGPDDIDGWHQLDIDDQQYILQKIEDCNKTIETRMSAKNKKNLNKTTNKNRISTDHNEDDRDKTLVINDDSLSVSSDINSNCNPLQDNLFREFRVIVTEVAKMKTAQEKIKIFSNLFKNGTDGLSFKGDLQLWVKLLLPATDRRVFNLQSKQLIKLFSKIFNTDQETMFESLEQGDIGTTIQYYFEQSDTVRPATKSTLTIQEIDEFLEKLSQLHREDEQLHHLESIINRCTANDLKVLVRLIVHDLRMKAGVKHVLEAICLELYQCYLICKDLNTSLDIWKKGNAQFYLLEHSKAIAAATAAATTSKTIKSKKPMKRKLSTNKHDNNNNSNNGNNKKKKVDTTSSFDDTLESVIVCDYPDEKLQRRKSIPNYFENIKLLLENGVAERHNEWIRYFIAYGGIVVQSDDCMKATHVLHMRDTVKERNIECSKHARHIIIEWIKDTVKLQCLQDYRPYSVRWLPGSNS